jgi:Na+/melibiose symporter-like transporter
VFIWFRFDTAHEFDTWKALLIEASEAATASSNGNFVSSVGEIAHHPQEDCDVRLLLLHCQVACGDKCWQRSAADVDDAGAGLRVLAPLRYRPFRALLAVFLANGIASALPATLILFFVQDRLQAPASMEPWFLASYFLAAGLAMAPVSRLVARWGLQSLWLASMGLSVLVFAWAAQLGSGDSLPFIAICVLSGLCLAADLTVPGAMLAGLINGQPERSGSRGHDLPHS